MDVRGALRGLPEQLVTGSVRSLKGIKAVRLNILMVEPVRNRGLSEERMEKNWKQQLDAATIRVVGAENAPERSYRITTFMRLVELASTPASPWGGMWSKVFSIQKISRDAKHFPRHRTIHSMAGRLAMSGRRGHWK